MAVVEVPFPLGGVTIAVTTAGLVAVALPGEDMRPLLARLTPRDGPAPDPAPFAAAVGDYLSGARPAIDVPLDWSLVRTGFRRDTLRALRNVPHGQVVSYASLAELAGRPRAVRAAASACATNPLPLAVPCHRVIRSDGLMGGFGGGATLKAALLDLEGVVVRGDPPRVMFG